MQKVLLLHTNRQYAASLAETVESLDVEYKIDVVSRVPLRDRISHLLSEEYDLVQTDELLVNGILACGSSIVSDTSFVASIRGWADYTNAHDQYGRFRSASIQLRTRATLRRASATIFFSNCTLSEFRRRYRVKNPFVIGRPIDTEYYQNGNCNNQASYLDHDQFNLFTATNLRYKNKLEGVVDTLEGLRGPFEDYDELQYTVAGNGRFLSELEAVLQDYPHSNRVNILGFREDIPDLLARADGFIYLSYLDAYPTVILEAQAAGLPVIGGDAVGIPETIGDAGLICEPTPDGVEAAVRRVLKKPYRKELAERSRKKMETYNEQCARRHVDVWDEVLGYS